MTTFADLGIDVPAGARGDIHVVCPQCTPHRKPANQRKKDLSVNVEKGVFHCHHCEWSGSVETYDQAARRQRREPVWERPRPMPAQTAPTLWQNAVSWFAGRGISEQVMHDMGITIAREYCPVCEAEMSHVLYPYYVDGVHINTKHRCVKKHFRMEAGAQRVLYNLDGCAGHEHVIVVEGEMDVLALKSAGIHNVISVPDGAPSANTKNYASKFTFLEAAESFLDGVKRFTIAVDADEPGQTLAAELIRRLGPEKCSRVTWDEGIKDANDALVLGSSAYLQSCIETAVPVPVEGIFTPNDLEDDLLRFYDGEGETPVGLGPQVIDHKYKIMPGYLTIMTGHSGHGKSTMLDQFIMWLIDNHGWRFAIFSPEQQPLHRHLSHLTSLHTGKPFNRKHHGAMTREEARDASRYLNDYVSFILPEKPTIDAVLERARIEIFRKGVKGIVLDPWNEFDHNKKPNETETEYVSQVLAHIRRFARTYGVHVWLMAHPTKMLTNTDGTERVPTLTDINGSIAFRNKADIGITVWRDQTEQDNYTYVYIKKVRFIPDMGEIGTVKFRYEPANHRFTEIGDVS